MRTVRLDGPVRADLTEVVLLLTGPDGWIERVQNLSRRDPVGFERQLAKLGPSRIPVASPDNRPFKAVHRGLLACSRATSCVVILDLPGLASSALVRPATAGDWTPPERPDPQRMLREADRDAHAGHYELALKKYLWFHRHAARFRRSLHGVRLSFALDAWFKLGGVYPPAMTALRGARDEALETLTREHTDEAFDDFAAINRKLDEEGRTVQSFVLLDRESPDMARRVFAKARPALIRAKEYALCGKYLKPKEDLSRALDVYRTNNTLAKEERYGPEMRDFAEHSLTNETTTLTALLVANRREGEANEVASAAKSEWDDSAFHAALEKALQGVVPEPWP